MLSTLSPSHMNSPPYSSSSSASDNLPSHSLFDSSRLIMQQPFAPTLREILGAYKFSKGQDGDCQLLVAVLNAKSAEDERLAAIAKLHNTMLEYEYSAQLSSSPSSSSYSSPRHRASQHLSSADRRSYFRHPSRLRREDESDPRNTDRASKRRDRSRRNPYERTQPPRRSPSLSPYMAPRSESTTSSPSAREAMSIGTLLSNDEDKSRNRRPVQPSSPSLSSG